MARKPKVVSQTFAEVGAVKYTVERFMSAIDKSLDKKLRTVFKAGQQLAADKVPYEALPAVLILAAWGDRYNEAIVDDYDALVARTRTAFDDQQTMHHPDLFFASCICILHTREQQPTIGAFQSVGIPEIYAALFGE